MICRLILLITFLNELELIFCTFKWFLVLQYVPIYHQSFICTHTLLVISFLNELELVFFFHTNIVIISTQLNSSNDCYQTLIILFNRSHLFADIEEVASITI